MKKPRWMWIGLAVSLAVGGILALFASASPDGLERVALDQGFMGKALPRPLLPAPIAEYLFPGIRNERLAAALAGITGTLLLFAVGYGAGMLVRRLRKAGPVGDMKK